jgi:histidinol-phosphatase (PHP family)
VLTSYHNHSFWSDGRASPANLLAEARRLGIDELGVSDHLVLDPHGHTPGWSMQPEHLPRYLADLDTLRRAQEPVLRIGIEADWIQGQGAVIAAALDDKRLDYAIGSVHQVSGMHVDTAYETLRWLEPAALERMYLRYWELVRDMARSGLFQVAGHLDLPKKLLRRPSAAEQPGDRADGCTAAHRRPRVGEAPNVTEALDAIAEAGMVVELNTAGWCMPCQECYPSPRLLRACKRRGIPVTINADAHSAQDLVRDFRRAVALLRELGFTELARLEHRRIVLQPLEDFAARLGQPVPGR